MRCGQRGGCRDHDRPHRRETHLERPKNIDDYGLDGASCPSTSLCVGVGGAYAVITTDPTAAKPTWSTPAKIDGPLNSLRGVSCASTSLCVAVDQSGNAVITTDPSAVKPAWGAPKHLDDVGFDGVSCPSTSLCVAVGARDAVITTEPTAAKPTWSVQDTRLQGLDAELGGVSCPSTSLCVAVGARDALITTGPTAAKPSWSAGNHIDGTNSLEAVSCASASFCVAVDDVGNAVVGRAVAPSVAQVGARRQREMTPHRAQETIATLQKKEHQLSFTSADLGSTSADRPSRHLRPGRDQLALSRILAHA